MSQQQDPETQTVSDPDDIRWTALDLDDLVTTYWDTIAPALERDGYEPQTHCPTYEWLRNHDFRGLIYALREHHDLSFQEFWRDTLGLDREQTEYDWGISDEETIRWLEQYLESQRDRSGLATSSIQTLRYRLNRYVTAYRLDNDTDAIVAVVAPDAETPPHAAVDRAWSAFDRLDDKLAPQTVRRIHGAVSRWYEFLIRRQRVALNPVSGLAEEYNWSQQAATDTRSNPALEPAHVRALVEEATSLQEQVMIVALCAWGLRSGEVATLHTDQLVFDPGDESTVPYIEFEERKNGPSTVSMLYGVDVIQEHLVELHDNTGSDRSEWSGYVFPSDRSASGHVSRQTILNWFDDLAQRALPAKISGEKPVPQMGRRYWYNAYAKAQEQLLELVSEIAAEQGSTSEDVVVSDYLSPQRRRSLRREYMTDTLQAAFKTTGL